MNLASYTWYINSIEYVMRVCNVIRKKYRLQFKRKLDTLRKLFQVDRIYIQFKN